MPLPCVADYNAVRCRATAKHSGCQCQNPAAFGMPVCRVHGARRPETVRKGTDHPQYRHGQETLEMKRAHRESSARLRALESLMHMLGMTKAKRTPGRKPDSF